MPQREARELAESWPALRRERMAASERYDRSVESITHECWTEGKRGLRRQRPWGEISLSLPRAVRPSNRLRRIAQSLGFHLWIYLELQQQQRQILTWLACLSRELTSFARRFAVFLRSRFTGRNQPDDSS